MYSTAINEVSREIPFEIADKFGDSALFTAYGCVLLECEAGKSFAYRALNIKTGKSAIVHRRVNPLTSSGLAVVVEKIRLSPVAGRGRYEIDMPPGDSLPHNILSKIQTHIFESVMPEYGYGIRDKQIELADHIQEAICKRVISLAEAEVGTGKTHAYLIAAALAKRSRVNDFWLRGRYPGQSYAASAYMPVIISTSSIALQNAIVRNYIPEISEMLMEHGIIKTPLSCVMRKGREHYVCEKNLLAYYVDADDRTKELLSPLVNGNASIDLASANNLTLYMKRRIGVTGRCDMNCPQYTTCRYLRYLRRVQSNEHDFQVCNHNYFLADLLHRSKGQKPLIPHYQAVIIDEAHKFLQTARQIYGTELESNTITRITDEIYGFTYEQGVSGTDVNEMSVGLTMQNERLFQLLNDSIVMVDGDEDETERYKIVMGKAVSRHLRNIRCVADELSTALSEKRLLKKYKGSCARIQRELSDIKEQAALIETHDDLVCWLEKPDKKRRLEQGAQEVTKLCTIPKQLNDMLYDDLWSKGIPVILTSGTLSAAGDFSHIKRKTGLDRAARLMETSKPSPFNHRENALIYISETVPFPDSRDHQYIMSVADETERLIRAAHGHAAILFTSYKVMDMVFQILALRGLGFPLFRLDRGGGNTIERFRHSVNGVIFASGSMWEGIDLPGDILSLLIIVKLPFAVPDPISEYEQSLYKDFTEYRNRVIVPEMIIKLKQGFGRLIRHETDTGVVALLDSRVRMDGLYRDIVLSALPACQTTSSITIVHDFFQITKEPAYFS